MLLGGAKAAPRPPLQPRYAAQVCANHAVLLDLSTAACRCRAADALYDDLLTQVALCTLLSLASMLICCHGWPCLLHGAAA